MTIIDEISVEWCIRMDEEAIAQEPRQNDVNGPMGHLTESVTQQIVAVSLKSNVV